MRLEELDVFFESGVAWKGSVEQLILAVGIVLAGLREESYLSLFCLISLQCAWRSGNRAFLTSNSSILPKIISLKLVHFHEHFCSLKTAVLQIFLLET